MKRLGVVAAKSAGATTAAIAFALTRAERGPVLVVGADPAGCDIAPYAGLAMRPGLMTLAAAARHPHSGISVATHTQSLRRGIEVLVGPSDPDLASAALSTVAGRLADTLRAYHGDVVVDGGRWWRTSPANPLLSACDVVVMVAPPTAVGIEAIRTRLGAFRTTVAPSVAAVLVGSDPYRPTLAQAVLDSPVAGALALDARGVAQLWGQGALRTVRRTPLVRSAQTVLDRLHEAVGEPQEVAS